MDIKKLQRVVVDALEDVKGQDITVFNTTGLTTLFDRVVIATATSNRQTRALASRVGEKVKAEGGQVISIEGLDTGEWVLVDLGDAVVHIMQPAIRVYYKLEEIWGGKPVRMVLGGGRPARAEPEPEPEPEPEQAVAEAAPRKAPARKTATKTARAATGAASGAGRKTAAKTAAKSTGRSGAKSAAKSAKSAAAPRRAPAAKSASAKPRAPRKTAAKRAS
jgi:ribosome-associated protein